MLELYISAGYWITFYLNLLALGINTALNTDNLSTKIIESSPKANVKLVISRKEF